MGRKKDLNPMEAYRRKQKKAQIAKNKRKRAEAKDKSLQRKDADWIMTEIQKLNRREKQEHGKNEEKYTNRRKKLLEAYNRAVRIRNIKEKTKRTASNHQQSKDTENSESSPTPPPIEQTDDISKHIEDSTNTHAQQKQDNDTQQTVTAAIHPTITPTNTLQLHPHINPTTNVYNHLYNPLLMHPYAVPSIYSDTLGAKSSKNHKQQPPIPPHPSIYGGHIVYPTMDAYYNNNMNMNRNNAKNMKMRPSKDAFDPLNPTNPMYNFTHPPMHKSEAPKPSVDVNNNVNTNVNTNVTNNVNKPKRQIEVIMDPKLRAMMPSSMRFKRKFEKTKSVRPIKKRKLDIAPDVGDSNSYVNETQSNRNVNKNFVSGNADAAYDKFMDEINYLIDSND